MKIIKLFKIFSKKKLFFSKFLGGPRPPWSSSGSATGCSHAQNTMDKLRNQSTVAFLKSSPETMPCNLDKDLLIKSRWCKTSLNVFDTVKQLEIWFIVSKMNFLVKRPGTLSACSINKESCWSSGIMLLGFSVYHDW